MTPSAPGITNSATEIAALLQQTRVIAIVGLSPKPWRDSHEVAEYLQNHGYRIVPVNPHHTGQSIVGEACYATLQDAASALRAQGQVIDMVDCFRKSEDIPPIALDAIAIGAKCLWMQLGISHIPAAEQALAAGLAVVMNRCTKIDHRMLLTGS